MGGPYGLMTGTPVYSMRCDSIRLRIGELAPLSLSFLFGGERLPFLGILVLDVLGVFDCPYRPLPIANPLPPTRLPPTAHPSNPSTCPPYHPPLFGHSIGRPCPIIGEPNRVLRGRPG